MSVPSFRNVRLSVVAAATFTLLPWSPAMAGLSPDPIGGEVACSIQSGFPAGPLHSCYHWNIEHLGDSEDDVVRVSALALDSRIAAIIDDAAPETPGSTIITLTSLLPGVRLQVARNAWPDASDTLCDVITAGDDTSFCAFPRSEASQGPLFAMVSGNGQQVTMQVYNDSHHEASSSPVAGLGAVRSWTCPVLTLAGEPAGTLFVEAETQEEAVKKANRTLPGKWKVEQCY